jgi:hypothetical protein
LRYLALRLDDVEFAGADHLAKPMLEIVLQLRRPFLLDRAARLGPEVPVIVCAAEAEPPPRRCC